MSPQEIYDHRMQWYPGFSVSVHSDKERTCKEWCRLHMYSQEWSLTRNTDIFEHTFRFEHEAHARAFEQAVNNG